MDADTIVRELSTAEGLPRRALLAARDNRDEIAARFTREIECYLERPTDDRQLETSLFFMFHMLGEWRYQPAYRSLTRLLRRPDGEIDKILGDAVTTTAHRVIAGVFDGDPQPIYDVILDQEADEFVRAMMCEALGMLVLAGRLEKGVVAKFLRDCFMNLSPQATNYVWSGWQQTIATLGLSELTTLVEKAFSRHFIDPGWCGFHHYQQDLAEVESGGQPKWMHQNCTPFDDTIGELSTWHGFSEKYEEQRKRQARAEERERARGTRVVQSSRTAIKVGRNDPCPCGSGTKFKKCCLN